jgi:hypothetical protein
MNIKSASVACGLYLAFLYFSPASAPADEPKAVQEEVIFEMREVSALEKNDMQHGRYLTRGQVTGCDAEPDKAVKAYPKLISEHPLYGKIKFYTNPAKREGIEYHFVLDQSGEPSDNDQKKAMENKEGPSLLESLSEKLLGSSITAGNRPKPHVVLSTYDRLYFDLNNDLDLTNDTVLKPMESPPWSSLSSGGNKEQTAFEYLNMDIDYGPDIGKRPYKILPNFVAVEYQNKTYYEIFFIATAAREGIIQIGEHKYNAIMAQPYAITGRFDRGATALYLNPMDSQETSHSWGFEENQLSTMRQVDGKIYITTTTPLGDKLIVKPYQGDFGLFKIGPGTRDIKDISVQGSLSTETNSIGFGPTVIAPGVQGKKASEYAIPVGDYLASYITIEYGHLGMSLSDNYHSDGKPQNSERTRTYGIKIRKDQPFVLDFSNKPEVLFASPAKDKTFKPGEEVTVKAVLVDPVLDIMIRRLNDTRQNKKETIKLGDGQEAFSDRPVSLDPTVTITDSSGNKVAEGPMPFG